MLTDALTNTNLQSRATCKEGSSHCEQIESSVVSPLPLLLPRSLIHIDTCLQVLAVAATLAVGTAAAVGAALGGAGALGAAAAGAAAVALAEEVPARAFKPESPKKAELLRVPYFEVPPSAKRQRIGGGCE